MQNIKQQRAPKKFSSEYKLTKRDLEDIYLLTQKLPNSLKQDMQAWSRDRNFDSYFYKIMNQFMFENENRNLISSAKNSIKIIDNLFLEKCPFLFIDQFFYILKSNKKKIEQYLDRKQADDFYRYVPTNFMIPFLQLYQLKLTRKQQIKLIQQFLQDSRTLNENLAKLPNLFHQDQRQNNIDLIITGLIKEKRFDIAGKVIKKLNVDKSKYPRVEQSLHENAARGMPRWQAQKFSWEVLEEVYGEHPSAIATCISNELRDRKCKKANIEGYASICLRIPQVLQHCSAQVKQKLKKAIEKPLPNKLCNNKFAPSHPQYFSLVQLGFEQKDVIMVNRQNIDQCVANICQSKVIGIDTQSIVAKTMLSKPEQSVALIQISTLSKVYLFDAFELKQMKFKSQKLNAFFKNKQVKIIGHTLKGDLNQTVYCLGFTDKVECQCIDVQVLFKQLYSGQRSGLASITETVLGKPLCKAYTLTNWRRRPLYKNQIHYAALDAVVVIKIWEILKAMPIPELAKDKKPIKGKKQSKQDEETQNEDK